ncbi:MAG: thermonuclease family protein [Candidatus Omnitrophica bacterium]|nr:thermonuclease family protein [Candidatus Omnitrophota bacterium]
MRSWKKLNPSHLRFFQRTASFLFLFFVLFSGPAFAGNNGQTAVVEEALSGSSVRLKGGQVLDYAGLESPPLQSVLPLVRQYGDDARTFNRSLVERKSVRLEWDSQIRNERGHWLAYVFLEDGAFVNLEILRAGHAKARIQPPNRKYMAEFRKAELAARRGKKGLWKEEPENPFIQSEYLGEKSTKIYYFPTSPELEGIPEAHLVKFRSRVEAKAAGYRPCFTCKEKDESVY